MNATFLWAGHVDAVIADENKWNLIRTCRNDRLARCDWTQLPDAPLELNEKQSWAAYRQALRDLPENYTTPDEVIFPTPPDGDP